MRFPGTQYRKRRAAVRFDIHVSAIAALWTGMLTGVAFYRHDQLRFGLDPPHRVYQVASVLCTQLEAELSTEFAGRKGCLVSSRAEVCEVCLDSLRRKLIQVGAHLGNSYRKLLTGQPVNCAFRDAEFRAWNRDQAAARGP